MKRVSQGLAWLGSAIGAAGACTPTAAGGARATAGATAAGAQQADGGLDDPLDAMFREGTPEQIAAQLEAMVGLDGGSEADGSTDRGDGASVGTSGAEPIEPKRTEEPKGRVYSQPVPLYKGVTF